MLPLVLYLDLQEMLGLVEGLELVLVRHLHSGPVDLGNHNPRLPRHLVAALVQPLVLLAQQHLVHSVQVGLELLHLGLHLLAPLSRHLEHLLPLVLVDLVPVLLHLGLHRLHQVR